MTVFAIGLLGAAWSWFAFTAMPAVNIPIVALPKPNAYDFVVQAAKAQVSTSGDLEKTLGIASSPRVPFEQRLPIYRTHQPQVNAWLKQNERAFQLLRQGFAYAYREPPQKGTPPPSHYAGVRDFARSLAAESEARAARGDWKGATRSALDGLHLGYDIPRGAPLIGTLVGYAVQAYGRRSLQELLPHLDAATCRSAAREIEKLRAGRVPFSEVLQQEKWIVAANILGMMKSGAAQSLAFQISGYNAATKKPHFRLATRRRVMREFLAYMDALSASAKQPYSTASTPLPPVDFLTGDLEPVFTRARWNDARAETGASLVMTALALRAYQLEKGAFPEKLTQLVPNYLQAVPADAFGAGEGLRYKKQGSTYVLWSVGPDTVDDGGKAIENPAKTATTGRFLVSDKSKGDFVFGVNR